MATRLTKKNEREDTTPESPSQRKQIEGRFCLQVDRQTKSTFATFEAAEAAGMAIKKSHPLVMSASMTVSRASTRSSNCRRLDHTGHVPGVFK